MLTHALPVMSKACTAIDTRRKSSQLLKWMLAEVPGEANVSMRGMGYSSPRRQSPADCSCAIGTSTEGQPQSHGNL